MARELSVSFNSTGASLYVVIRLESDGTVWSVTNSALETYSAGSLSSYAIALTDEGGDLYAADMPASLPAGDYRFFYYEQAGGSPATTDLILKSPVRSWDGSTVSDPGGGGTVTLDTYALTTLAAVKRRLGIDDTDSDDLLTEIINGVSAEIERVCGRQFKARDYRCWLNGANQREVTLPQWPVQYVTRLAFGVNNALSLTYSGAGIRASASVYKDPETGDAGGLRLVSVESSGIPTATNLAFATYRSVSAVVTAVNAVSGWAATTLVNVPSLDIHPGVGGDALGRTVVLTYPDRSEYSYAIDHDAGILKFDRGDWWCVGYRGINSGPEGVAGWYGPMTLPRQFQGAICEYRAGYETVPADVQLVATELVYDNYYDAQIGKGVSELKLGPSVVKFSDSQQDYVQERLRKYIDPSRMMGGVS